MVGGSREELNDLVKREIPTNVHCHGRVTQAQLTYYYKKFSIGLAPYTTNVGTPDGTNTSEYMSPLKIFEYMGWGKVVLASDLPALREVLSDGSNALLLPPDDPLKWEDALRSLSDQKFATMLARTAYQDVIKSFSWDKRAAAILRLL